MSQPTLQIFGIVAESIVDGPGLRFSVFTQGCPHECPGCHNPQSHDPAAGKPMEIAEIIEKIKANPLLSGITLTGGEPMAQAIACLALIQALPPGLDIWIYTGYTYAEILASGDPNRIALAHRADVLVDGRFILAELSLGLPFRGSRNQRAIDIKKTLAKGEVVQWEPDTWDVPDEYSR